MCPRTRLARHRDGLVARAYDAPRYARRKHQSRVVLRFDFADDVVLLADLMSILLAVLDVLSEEVASTGLIVDWKKPKVQLISYCLLSLQYLTWTLSTEKPSPFSFVSTYSSVPHTALIQKATVHWGWLEHQWKISTISGDPTWR